MEVYQQFDVDVVSPVCIFIRNETPAKVLSYGFLETFSVSDFIKTETSAQVFSFEFW